MMFGGGMLLGWLVPVILLVLGGAWLFNNGASASRSKNDGLSPHNRGKTADEILQERYARGEITQGEYREMSKTLHR